jgi:hypothetical protein
LSSVSHYSKNQTQERVMGTPSIRCIGKPTWGLQLSSRGGAVILTGLSLLTVAYDATSRYTGQGELQDTQLLTTVNACLIDVGWSGDLTSMCPHL